MADTEPYSKREVDLLIGGVTDKVTSAVVLMEQHLQTFTESGNEGRKDNAETLDRIEAQTIKTNGSVASIKKWQEQVVGGTKVAIGFIILVILPLAIWMLSTQAEQAKQLQKLQSNLEIKSALATP